MDILTPPSYIKPFTILTTLADLRNEYARASLTEADVDPHPVRQFERWFEQALQAAVPEPNAMTLATVGVDGRPTARIVLLKGIDDGGFTFYTNYLSRKGRELAHDAHACLLFYWIELERQVRIDGTARKIDAAESNAYFASRPLASRIGAWASPQSEIIADRAALETLEARYAAQYGDAPPRPPHWGGYRLTPDAIEFWQGRPSRLHDRIQYLRAADGGWRTVRLAP